MQKRAVVDEEGTRRCKRELKGRDRRRKVSWFGGSCAIGKASFKRGGRHEKATIRKSPSECAFAKAAQGAGWEKQERVARRIRSPLS